MRSMVLIGAVSLLPLVMPAQLTTSVVRGHISDSSGAAVVGAELKIVNTQTNVERSITTNNDGDYEAPDLQRGTYRLTVTQPGFKVFVADNIVLESSQIRRIDATLEVVRAVRQRQRVEREFVLGGPALARERARPPKVE